jgi:ABC-2 type transport system permease protein
MVGGQYLLTTTIEEKSSRVVEVLLSAVSPMQLMTGKILGQMAVGVVLLSVYMGVGMAALSAFSLLDLISPMTIAYVIIYFVLAYFIIASLMAAIGASVNELREAQSLMGPVMMVLMLPYIFGFPISRDPNSTLAFVLSMVPPMSPFAMVIRITSNEPIPAWQIALSLALTAFAAYVCVWFAAKVFRIGLLMYGKPPNLKTLIRWVRMA